MIGISGINGAGKTTLAKILSKEFNCPIVTLVDSYIGKPNEIKIAITRQWRLLRAPRKCILDRCWLDRKVYTKFFNTELISKIFCPFERKPQMTIFIDEKPEIAYKRQDNFSLEELKILREMYLEEIAKYEGDLLIYRKYIILVRWNFWKYWLIHENLRLSRSMLNL